MMLVPGVFFCRLACVRVGYRVCEKGQLIERYDEGYAEEGAPDTSFMSSDGKTIARGGRTADGV
jgi:hypothetical protein